MSKSQKKSHWLFKLKSNQHDLYEELLRLFKRRGKKQSLCEKTELVGGRIEVRQLFLFPKLAGFMDWPSLAQGVVIHKSTIIKRTGEMHQTLQFAITNLPVNTDPEHILSLYRNHWSVENKLHYILDVSMGEDACRVKAGAGVLSGLRKLTLGILHKIKEDRTIPTVMHQLASKTDIATLFAA